jgi:TRAP-type transport system small permease protein
MERKPMGIGDYVIAVLFATTILVITAQVLWRYAFGSPLVWTEEAARYLFMWITFLGAALAVRDGIHIRVTLLTDRLPARVRRVMTVVQLVLMVLLMGFLVYVGVVWVRANTGSRTPALGLPLSYAVYTSLPAAMLWGIYFALRRAFKSLRGRDIDPPPPSEAEAF